MKYILLCVVIFFCCCSNGPEQKQDAPVKASADTISDRLTGILNKANYYPNKVSFHADTLFVLVQTSSIYDIGSPTKMNVLREVTINEIGKCDLQARFFAIRIKDTTDVRLAETLRFNLQAVKETEDFYDRNPQLLHLYKFILKNITGEELANFNHIISAIYLLDGKEKEIPDFIDCIYHLYFQCINDKRHYDRDYLQLLKDIRSAAIESPDIWPEFDVKEIDFFITYCDSI